jgi:hypothetical protein
MIERVNTIIHVLHVCVFFPIDISMFAKIVRSVSYRILTTDFFFINSMYKTLERYRSCNYSSEAPAPLEAELVTILF